MFGFYSTIFYSIIADSIVYGYFLVTPMILLSYFIVFRSRNNLKICLSISNLLLAFVGALGLIYFIVEIFNSWYNAYSYEQFAFINRFFGPYLPIVWCYFISNGILPQFFWFKKFRGKIWLSVFIIFLHYLGVLMQYTGIFNVSSWRIQENHSIFEIMGYLVALVLIYVFLKWRINRKSTLKQKTS